MTDRPWDAVDADSIRTPETQWQSQVTDLADMFGWHWYHTYDSRRSPEGFPDLVLARPGETIFAELKSEGEELEPEQVIWYDVLKSNPANEVYVWWPKDWDEITERLQRAAIT